MIDTNIIIAALIKDSKTRHLILHPKLELYCIKELMQETIKYKDYIVRKAKITEDKFDEIFKILLENITLVPFDKIKSCIDLATELIGNRDSKDIPFLSLALCIKVQGIWSNDKDFNDITEVRKYNTKEIIEFID